MAPKIKDVLLVTDESYTSTLQLLLDSARESVDLMAFAFVTSGRNAPFTIARKLIELSKRKRPPVIRIYLEGHRETASKNQATANYLKRNGLTNIVFGSTHAKGVCVDQRYLLFGSTNLTNQSMTKNYETNLVLSDQRAIENFTAYMDYYWKGGQQGGVHLGAPMIPDGEFRDAIVEMINAAKKRIDFSIYFFDEKKIETALIRAHRRGVLINGLIHDHRTFALSYVKRSRACVERLRKAGIESLAFGPVHLFSHSKYLLRDSTELCLGTGNWIHEDVETHPQLYIRFISPNLGKQLAEHLQVQIKKQSD